MEQKVKVTPFRNRERERERERQTDRQTERDEVEANDIGIHITDQGPQLGSQISSSRLIFFKTLVLENEIERFTFQTLILLKSCLLTSNT